jgi:type II secretory ATPase GspE/PulE/Tfp pilus assembly ATPase PilB-like protein
VRVLPTVYGERVDVHLEGPPKTALQPAELGMPKPELDRYEAMLRARSGLIIHGGLSGSGRCTALLAALCSQARAGRDACAVLSKFYRDIPQVTVSTAAAGPDQAALLRASRKRGSGILAVDDLSCPETMAEALAAAQEGFLVLGCLAADGALAVLRRMLEDNVAGAWRQALLGVCAHRLPRRLCACRKLAAPLPADMELLGPADKELRIGQPVGCPACMHTGFRGAVPIFEVLEMGEPLRGLLKAEADHNEWLALARQSGMATFSDGLRALVRDGVTSLPEARRNGLEKRA